MEQWTHHLVFAASAARRDLWLVFSLDRTLHSRWNGTTFFVITSGTCVVFLLLSPTSFAPRHWKTLWTPCGTRRWSTTASPTTKCREKLSGKEQTSPPSVKFFWLYKSLTRRAVFCLQTLSERRGQVRTQRVHRGDASRSEETEVWPEEELQCLFGASDPGQNHMLLNTYRGSTLALGSFGWTFSAVSFVASVRNNWMDSKQTLLSQNIANKILRRKCHLVNPLFLLSIYLYKV